MSDQSAILPAAIRAVTEGHDLSAQEMETAMRSIMTGEATQAQIGGFLVGLRMKGETVEEIAAAARVMRELATKVEVESQDIVDVVGTGGDGAHTFNISTASALVVAGAGGKVAKHGNRSVSSASGAADLLETAGVNLELTPAQVARCIDEVGVGFMFAQRHHAAMRHAIGPRREMAIRTVFNLLGPLTNPAGARNQLVGVFGAPWVRPVAEVLQQLGSRHVLVVHSDDGLDEISIAGPTQVAELRDDRVSTYQITPDQFGVSRGELSALVAHSAEESFAKVQGVLSNIPGPTTDVVRLNAGAAIYAAGITDSLAAGVERATESIASGAARQKLAALVELSQSFDGGE